MKVRELRTLAALSRLTEAGKSVGGDDVLVLAQAIERGADQLVIESKANTTLLEVLNQIGAAHDLEVLRRGKEPKTFREGLDELLLQKPRFLALEALKKLPIRRPLG